MSLRTCQVLLFRSRWLLNAVVETFAAVNRPSFNVSRCRTVTYFKRIAGRGGRGQFFNVGELKLYDEDFQFIAPENALICLERAVSVIRVTRGLFYSSWAYWSAADSFC